MVVFSYLLHRAIRHWQLFLLLSLVVILGTTLLASGPLLVDTLLAFGLQQKLITAASSDRSLNLQTYARAEQAYITALDAQVRAAIEEHLGVHIQQVILSIDSTWMIPYFDGQPATDQRLNLAYYEGIREHVELVEGSWPETEAALPQAIPVLIGEVLAQAHGLQVGDRIALSKSPDEAQPSRWLIISGILRPRDPREDYWFAAFNPFHPERYQRANAHFSVLVAEEANFQGLQALVPATDAKLTWHVNLSPESISVETIPDLLAHLAMLKIMTIEQHRFLLNTGLPQLLSAYTSQAQATRAMLYVLVGEIVLLVLYYAIMVAGLSMQHKVPEFAMLHSRGATAWQVIAVQVAETSLVCILGLFSGPALAGLLLRGILRAGTLAGFAPAGWVLSLPPASWLAALGGVIVFGLGMLLPVIPAVRQSILTYQRSASRPAQTAWWQRLYLDVVLLVLGLILLWRLQLHGGITVQGTYRTEIDWLLLLSPLALLLGSATILLRLFPLILRLGARLAEKGTGLPAVLALWQTSRSPAQVALLVLLLTLATSLGVLSTGLGATLDISEVERASYAVGSDVRVLTNQARPASLLEDLPGIRAQSSAYRSTGTVDLGSFQSFPRFEALAVDPQVVPSLSTFRADFADEPVETLLVRLESEASISTSSFALPGQPARIGIWLWCIKDENLPTRRHWYALRGESDLDRIKLSAKVVTAQGYYYAIDLQPGAAPEAQSTDQAPPTYQELSDTGEWRFFAANLPAFPASAYPLRLHTIWLYVSARTKQGEPIALDMRLVVDDLVVEDAASGEALIAEGFEDPARLWALNAPGSVVDLGAGLPTHSGAGNRELIIDFEYTRKPVPLKLLPLAGAFVYPLQVEEAWIEPALPVLVSPAFLNATQLDLGDNASVWISSLAPLEIQVAGKVAYFPTLYENLSGGAPTREAGFLILSRDLLLERLNDRTPSPVNVNEDWAAAAQPLPANTMAQLETEAERVWALDSVLSNIQVDPIGLGLRSVTGLATLTTALLSIVGFTTHFYTSARRREAAYGLLRSMGLSPWQLYGSLILEQVVLILAGFGLGTLLGVIINQLVLPGLPVTFGDLPPVPPFSVHNDWSGLGRIFLILGGTFILSISLVTILLWRARLHRILRIGEE